MRKLWKHNLPSNPILVAAALAIVLLAALQYYLVVQVSQAERERMQASVEAGASRFGEDFDREIARAYFNFRMDATTLRDRAWDRYARRYTHWVTTAPYPRMVSNVYLVDTDEKGQLRLSRFAPAANRFQPAEWPVELDALRGRVEHAYRTTHMQGDVVVGETLDPVAEEAPALVIPVARPWLLSDRQTFDLNAELIIDERWLTQRRCPACRQPAAGGTLFAYTIITLDRAYMKQGFIPALTNRHFARNKNFDYHLAVVSRADPQSIVYQSETSGLNITPDSGDATVDIFSLRPDEFRNLLVDDALRLGQPPTDSQIESVAISVQPLAGQAISQGRWLLVVKHRAGSLEAAVAYLRSQNLVVSFGSLLLLAASVMMVFVSTRRSQRLAQQQIEFVAAVSHELRTPLAVICSAGDNLAAGVVHDPQQARRYGAVIRGEGHRLAEMVEQVLEYAGAQSGKQTYSFNPVDVGGLVEAALAACRPQLDDGGFVVETSIQRCLPVVYADVAAVKRSIQNLIVNAIKYSGESRWIGLSVRVRPGERGPEVRISVQDRGIGIAPIDLPHIFEPFYRSRDVVAAQIRGSGLGLRLVKHIVEAHGGSVFVESASGQGSTFILTLPCEVSAYSQTFSTVQQ